MILSLLLKEYTLSFHSSTNSGQDHTNPMPVHRRKNTTPPPPNSTQEQTAPALPDQQTFQQYVRESAGAGLRVVLERYRRYEPHVAQGLTEMFGAGTSTRHPWEKWPKPCWEWHPVPSVGSTRASPTNMRCGGSVLCKTTGALSIWMGCISAFVMGRRPIPRSS